MTIARAQMYRQLYQMGGIGTLPMDYGQPLQVNNQGQAPMPNYSSAVNITANPLLNYGQTELGNSGGTPLTMRTGGITRLGYANGDVVNIDDQLMQQSQQPQQPTQAPLQGIEGAQSDIKDPKQALEIIIQMLIAQGIPPEQAKQIALQMVQAVAQGGMQEMSDERITARFGGAMNNGRAQYGIGSFFSGAAKAVGSVVSGVTNAVKSVASSPLGKAALTAAAIYFGAPMIAGSSLPAAEYWLGDAAFGSQGVLGMGGQFSPFSGTLANTVGLGPFSSGIGNISAGFGVNPASLMGKVTGLAKNPLTSFIGGFGIGKATGVPQQQEGESTPDYQNRVNQYKAQYAPLLNPTIQYPGNPFYTQMAANGGRIGYQGGGIGNLVSQATREGFFGTPMMAMGGRMQYAMGAEVPTRQNQGGITELDYRETGGFVPPIGIKEKADDIPAMLSNNEFVFTADAVRNAGDGDVNQGAKRMYSLMKNLEAGGSV